MEKYRLNTRILKSFIKKLLSHDTISEPGDKKVGFNKAWFYSRIVIDYAIFKLLP